MERNAVELAEALKRELLREYFRERNKAWRLANPERWKKKNAEYSKAWRLRNPEKFKAYQKEYRARKRKERNERSTTA